MKNASFWGYRRQNGRMGTRNYVIILPVDDISNRTAEAVAANVPGTLALPHAYGRLQFGQDLELFFRTLIGVGSNPNVAAVVVIGIEPRWTERIASGIRATGKPVEAFSIEGRGDFAITAMAARAAAGLLQQASELRREEAPVSELWVSAKCGESDTTTGLASCPTVGRVLERVVAGGGNAFFGETSELTGGEHIVADRMKTPELREQFMAMFRDYAEMIERTGDDLLGSQPTEGNIAGGLSTIEEKALGNIEKIGRLMVDSVLSPAEAPSTTGLHFMDTSSAAAECVTLFAAAGATVHLFPTGQGNVIGNPILPVLKVSGNPKTVAGMSEHIDVDVSQLLTGEINIDEAGDQLWEMTLRAACGRLMCAEVLGHREFVLTKLHRSA